MTFGPGIARTPLPEGFSASGVNSGVRRYRPDLGVLISDVPAVVAGVFTLNEYKAAPVTYCQRILPAANIRAIVTNSGQANAATGDKGNADNFAMAKAVAENIGCDTQQVLTASTGTIGIPMEIGKIVDAVPELIARQGVTAEPFALAILTTDLVPKTVTTEVKLSGGVVRVTGICKGSGMIHPNMATMLGYILTDAKVSQKQASSMLSQAVNLSFNMISVDGECSTNDATFLMANGVSGVTVKAGDDEIIFQKALSDVSQVLAKSIARDGEGATKLIEVSVVGAPDELMAKRAARGLVMSPLVKTAIHGEDPNWGRILARLGSDSVPRECLDRMVLKVQGSLLFQNAAPVESDLQGLRRLLKEDTVKIDIDLQSGSHKAMAWGCDLSKKYVEINGEYTT